MVHAKRVRTMFLRDELQMYLFAGVDGGGAASTTMKRRYFTLFITSSLLSIILLVSKTLLLYPFTTSPFEPILMSYCYFFTFFGSLLFWIHAIYSVSSPISQIIDPSDVRFGCFVCFVVLCAFVTAISVLSLCWGSDIYNDDAVWPSVDVVGFPNVLFRGFVVGVFYGLDYFYWQRGVMQFPVIQRPLFFRFKMGISLSIRRALKFSAVGCLLSGLLSVVLPTKYRSQGSYGHFILEQTVFYISNFLVILLWELIHHLLQVLHTERFVFATPIGSAAAAAETNPSEPLLTTLEKSTPKSLVQHLGYLDLCMVCEGNVDTWRRAAFFEESGKTYKRVIAAGLKPLEQFVQNLAEGLESSAAENSLLLSDRLSSPTEQLAVQKLYGSFYDSQLCTWSARITSSLTARSRKEDRFGVARSSGSNAAVISTLLSSLLAVETLMEKMTSTQSAHLMGRAEIKWATINTGKRDSLLYADAYSLANILKTSIYCIVSAFHDPMLRSDQLGDLQRDWIISGKPLYGTHELLLHKLRVFLDFQAS